MGTERVAPDLVLPADLDHLGEARAWVKRHAEAAGFAPREAAELELLLTETVSNVIRHGYQRNHSCEVRLHADVLTDRLVLRVVDRGPAFDPTKGEPVDLSEPRAGGYGLYLMETLADELSWRHREDGANELLLTRFRPSPGAGA